MPHKGGRGNYKSTAKHPKPSGVRPRVSAPNVNAKVGGYRAPVDTTGLDPEMKRQMGVPDSAPAKPDTSGQRLNGAKRVNAPAGVNIAEWLKTQKAIEEKQAQVRGARILSRQLRKK